MHDDATLLGKALEWAWAVIAALGTAFYVKNEKDIDRMRARIDKVEADVRGCVTTAQLHEVKDDLKQAIGEVSKTGKELNRKLDDILIAMVKHEGK
jgi:hypothetical protein